MKAISQFFGKATLRCGVLATIAMSAAWGQTLINLGTQGRNIDFSNAPVTRPEKTGSSLPATCFAGDLFFNLAAPAGQNLYACVTTNTWAPIGSGSGLADPGSNGLVVRTGLNTTTAIAAPNGTVVGTTDTQTLTNKTVDGVSPPTFAFLDATSSIQTQLNSKQATLSFSGTGSKTVSATAAGASGHCAQWTATGDIGDAGAACGTGGSGTSPGGSNGQIQYNNAGAFGGLSTIPAANMPAYTGDVTSTAGTTVNTLATVNSNVGTFGSATQCLTITVDAKGRITAAGQSACSGTTYTAGSGLTLTGNQFSLTSPIAGSFLPARTGDVTSPAGSTVNTLATVNSTPGTFGSTTQCPTFTVNAKGLVTAASQAACAGGGTGITQLTGDVTTPASSSGSTAATLATVNSTPGTFGSATATPVITVNGKGLITAVTTATISGTGGSSTATALSSGTLANLPATCAAGAVYFATDQPAGQQLYTCSSANVWTQIGSVGPSGALAYTNGSLDIVTSVVPRLTAFNTFSGLDAFSNGLQLTTATAAQPSCTSSTRGLFWYQNNGASKDSVQICVFNGTSFTWNSLY